MTVTPVQLAAMAGRTGRWARAVIAEGGVQPVRRGVYPLVETMRALISHLERIAAQPADARSRDGYRNLRTKEIEQRIAMRDRDLIPVADAVAELRIFTAVCRSEIEGLPSQFARTATERHDLRRLCGGAVNRMADACDRAERAARTGNQNKGD